MKQKYKDWLYVLVMLSAIAVCYTALVSGAFALDNTSGNWTYYYSSNYSSSNPISVTCSPAFNSPSSVLPNCPSLSCPNVSCPVCPGCSVACPECPVCKDKIGYTYDLNFIVPFVVFGLLLGAAILKKRR